VPLEMKEGTIPVRGTKGLSTRPRCITLLNQLSASVSTVVLVTLQLQGSKHPPLATSPHPVDPSASCVNSSTGQK
jgi:hypothetical protein